MDHKDNVPIKDIAYLLRWGETQNGFEIVTFIDIDLLCRLTLCNIHNQLLSASEIFVKYPFILDFVLMQCNSVLGVSVMKVSNPWFDK